MPELRVVLTIAALVLAMLVAGFVGFRQRAGALILALLGFVWLTLDSRFEGELLLTFSSRAGLTSSDFVGLAGIVIAAGEWWWLRRRQRVSGETAALADAPPRS